MNDDITKLTSQKIESTLYQIDNAHFQSFEDMTKYLESAQLILNTKIDKLDEKIDIVYEQFIRTSSIFEMNNKKRQKQEELLKIERERISKDLVIHEGRLSQFQINPITLILKQKKQQLDKLEQTKEIIEEFNKLLKGNEQQIQKIMPLDEKSFSSSALRIYVFKILLEDIHGVEYESAKLEINKKYMELKNKIIQNFKEGYRNKDTKLIRNTLPYCEEYELMDEISDFYNEQVFKSVGKLTKMQGSSGGEYGNEHDSEEAQLKQGEKEIKNMFFLIEQGFESAFSYKDQTTGQINPYQINAIMGQYSEQISRKLITYVFQKIIRESLQSILHSVMTIQSSSSTTSTSTSAYLFYLQVFFDQSKKLLKDSEKIIQQERIQHLMSTYFESIFDAYLDTYLTKQLDNLDEMYEKCSKQILKDIQQLSVNGATQYSKEKEKVMEKKKTFKKIITDFAIDSKKNISNQSTNSTSQAASQNNEIVTLKIQSMLNIFMNPLLQKIFVVTKNSLARNNKIAKINEVDRNRNQILQIFISNMEEIIQHLISLISEIVPGFQERAPYLDPQFFQIVPNINLLLQRIEFMYEEYKKENKYRLAQAIKLDQKKQNFIQVCSKSLNKVVGEALAAILTMENYILLENPNQYYIVNVDQMGNTTNDTCSKVIAYIQKYIRTIQRITLANYRQNILKNLGLQFVNLLIQYYSRITYTKEGLSKLFMDIAKLKATIAQFYNEEIDRKFKILRSLIDIYVVNSDQRSIQEHIKAEGLIARVEKEEIIAKYVANKMSNEKK